MIRRILFLVLLLMMPIVLHAAPAGKDAADSPETVMQQFVQQDEGVSAERKISEKRKQQILLWMGIGLLIGLFTTGGLGISMVVFDKQVYVAHMISAGLTVTLAVVHAATSIAWFWPY